MPFIGRISHGHFEKESNANEYVCHFTILFERRKNTTISHKANSNILASTYSFAFAH